MGLRITTWNVNGIRNPFQYQPWRSKKTFEGMFDILAADIVVFQETKIQRKDLRDDMVLVQGWDCYWSLPRHKKGYSGVVIYTRQSACAPIRAEEGITGVLCPPNSSTSFLDLPEEQQIGGYPTPAQLATCTIDATTIDSEGRCIILEFPAFVLFGVYSPANRDESRDEFRLGFLSLLDARVRNLIAMGKRVVLTGDLNISREELDTANAESSMRKNGLTAQEYISTPARRLFNQLLEGGKVIGARDEGREEAVMWDICRAFHRSRKGMFTCWEQKINARPGNCGARIDYVLCSMAMKDWFSDSNIQEGLMGSDHCPVYAIMKDEVLIDGKSIHVQDMMNPTGMFHGGHRQREYSTKDILPLSGKLIPEFDGRRSIRDMFSRKSSLLQPENSEASDTVTKADDSLAVSEAASLAKEADSAIISAVPASGASKSDSSGQALPATNKRSFGEISNTKPSKRVRPSSLVGNAPPTTKGQQSLKGFFKPKNVPSVGETGTDSPTRVASLSLPLTSDEQNPQVSSLLPTGTLEEPLNSRLPAQTIPSEPPSANSTPYAFTQGSSPSNSQSHDPSPHASFDEPVHSPSRVHDPIESKSSWTKLFTKPAPPRCECHHEPCVSFLTKKSGVNCGRSFWMCARPLGPSGIKERGTQWRCPTFIWGSDWNSIVAKEGGGG